jgi:4-hydroxy 2-oxovalerate aldolase
MGLVALDCTMRDGGYYPEWKFDLNLVNTYLKTMEESKINAIEIGFRTQSKQEFANVTDEFIVNNLYIPNVEYFGVMVNASDMTPKIIKESFTYADKSPINLVRMTLHFKYIDSGESICKELKNLGYTITCNLMQAADKSFEEIRDGAKKIEEWNVVDILYLADSLGGMDHDSVNYSFKAIKEGWSGLTGFHAHNNKGRALDNSIEAVDIGIDWIDSTILGMGRGPGNTETEYLLGELNKRGFGEFKLESIYKLVLNEFLLLQKQHGWGPSLLYYLAAEYNIHPTYIQKMLLCCSMDKILDGLSYLRDRESSFFDDNLFKELVDE